MGGLMSVARPKGRATLIFNDRFGSGALPQHRPGVAVRTGRCGGICTRHWDLGAAAVVSLSRKSIRCS